MPMTNGPDQGCIEAYDGSCLLPVAPSIFSFPIEPEATLFPRTTEYELLIPRPSNLLLSLQQKINGRSMKTESNTKLFALYFVCCILLQIDGFG